MRLLVQRVKEASVAVEGEVVGSISKGVLVFLGIPIDAQEVDIPRAVKKILNLRIFKDDAGKMNRSVVDIKGELLIVSQFTLYGDASFGNRPSFIRAMGGLEAKRFYDTFIEEAKKGPCHVEAGRFGADMAVSLVNDGPVTLMIELESNHEKKV